jgi:hypothetical protein
MRKITTRIQLEAKPERIAELEGLMLQTDIRTKADLVNDALTLFEWAIKERRTGRIIASLDEATQRYKQVLLPSVERTAPAESNGR